MIIINSKPFLQVFGTFCFSLGVKKAVSTIINHPALVLTPTFSFWRFGPVRADGCCAYQRKESKICLSFRLTWVNTLLTFCGMATLFLYPLFIFQSKEEYGEWASAPLDVWMFIPFKDYRSLDEELKDISYFDYLANNFIQLVEENYSGLAALSFAFAIISLLLIQFLDKCKWLCCGCLCCCCWKRYEDCCFPMTQKLVYDTENPHQ